MLNCIVVVGMVVNPHVTLKSGALAAGCGARLEACMGSRRLPLLGPPAFPTPACPLPVSLSPPHRHLNTLWRYLFGHHLLPSLTPPIFPPRPAPSARCGATCSGTRPGT